MSNLDVCVEEFTTPNPITVKEDTGMEELYHLMKQYGVRHFPVIRGNQIVGILSERDLKIVAGLNLSEQLMVRAGDIMVKDPVSVSSDQSVESVAFEMSKLKIGSVLVYEGNEFLGIFTVTDALNALIEITRAAKSEEA